MKKTLIILFVLVLVGSAAYIYFDESIPTGDSGRDAEVLTDKMFEAIGKEAWDTIPFIRFSFRNDHHYVWNKLKNSAEISWDDYTVKMNLSTQTGTAIKDGVILDGELKQNALKKAWEIWCNDSFWLNAPAKARDVGTSRSLVKMDDGSDGLLVQYSGGGVTPGDAYLWALDETGLPIYYKMWVSIIPIGGLEASWSDWKDINGAKVSTSHALGSFNIQIENLKAGDSLEEIQ